MAIFPKLLGESWSVQKQPVWNTAVHEAASGKEVRIGLWRTPTWEFTLIYEMIRAAQRYDFLGAVPVLSTIITSNPYIANDFAALCGFFLARKGIAESWLFDDPDDHSAIQDIIGVGDGSSVNFQAQRHLGDFSEPLRNLNGAPTIAALWQPNTGVANGALIVPSVVSSFLRGNRIVVSWQTPGWPCFYSGTAGSTGSSEPNWDDARVPGMTIVDGGVTWTNQGVAQILYIQHPLSDWAGGSHAVNSAILPVSNNAGGFTYIATIGGNSGGGRPSFNQSLGGTTPDGSVTWTNYGVTLPVSGDPIVPQLPSVWSVNAGGLVTFVAAPPLNSNVRLTSGFYFSCRFLEDIVDFEEFSYKLYKLGKLDFVSVKEPTLVPVEVSLVAQRNGSLSVGANAYQATISFVDLGTAAYAISMAPNWNTTAWWSSKASNGFVANFNTPAPSDGSAVLDWGAITN